MQYQGITLNSLNISYEKCVEITMENVYADITAWTASKNCVKLELPAKILISNFYSAKISTTFASLVCNVTSLAYGSHPCHQVYRKLKEKLI